MENFDREEMKAIRMLLLLATSPDRMAGMGLDPGGKEFQAAMRLCDMLGKKIKVLSVTQENLSPGRDCLPPGPGSVSKTTMALSYIVPGEHE